MICLRYITRQRKLPTISSLHTLQAFLTLSHHFNYSFTTRNTGMCGFYFIYTQIVRNIRYLVLFLFVTRRKLHDFFVDHCVSCVASGTLLKYIRLGQKGEQESAPSRPLKTLLVSSHCYILIPQSGTWYHVDIEHRAFSPSIPSVRRTSQNLEVARLP